MRQEQFSEQQSSNSQNRPDDTSRQTTEAGTHNDQSLGPQGIPASNGPDLDQDRLQRRREQEMREAEARLRPELDAEVRFIFPNLDV